MHRRHDYVGSWWPALSTDRRCRLARSSGTLLLSCPSLLFRLLTKWDLHLLGDRIPECVGADNISRLCCLSLGESGSWRRLLRIEQSTFIVAILLRTTSWVVRVFCTKVGFLRSRPENFFHFASTMFVEILIDTAQ